MTYSFSRVLTAAAIGMLLLMPVFGMTTLNVQTAHAQQLETDDFFDEDFTDSTGLGQADLKSTIGNLIRVFLGFLGIIAVVMVLLGGFKWMTASGNDEKVQDAKKLLVAGIVGLAIILSADAITTYFISFIIDASA